MILLNKIQQLFQLKEKQMNFFLIHTKNIMKNYIKRIHEL